MLCEGFKRLKEYGPTLLYIGGAADTPAANRLYESTGFTIRRDYYFWNKIIISSMVEFSRLWKEVKKGAGL